MREFIKSFFSFGLASVIERLIAFLLLPIYTRYFSTAEFGVIDLITVVLGVVVIFAHLQLETSLQRYYYEYEGEERNLLISTIVMSVTFFSIIITVLLILTSTEISTIILKKDQYSGLIKLAALQLPFTNYSMLALVVLRYKKKNMLFTGMIIAKVTLTVLFILVFVVWLKMGLYGVFYAQLAGLIISSILLFFTDRMFSKVRLSNVFFKKAFAYAMPQFPARIGSVVLTYANRFFMVGYLTIGAIGIYSLSIRLASVLQLVYTAFIMAWGPFMFEQQRNPEHKKIFANVLLLASAPIFLLVSLVSLFSSEIVGIVASKRFFSGYHYLGGLCLYFALFIFKEVVDIGPKFTEKTKYLSYTFFLSVVVNLVSLYFFIRLFGLYGVVYSMVITNTVLLVVSWIISNKLYYIPYNIYTFVLMALPAFFLAILSMYLLPSLLIKFFVLMAVSLFYGFAFFKFFKVFRNSNQLT